MSSGSAQNNLGRNGLEPLEHSRQLWERAYQALLDGIVSGRINLGIQLGQDSIAQQLQVSTTPVREAFSRLEKDGLVVKLPYQGWFVRQFDKEEIRELYELRAGLECIGVRLACKRINDAEVEWLREHQSVGEAAVARGDMDAYRIYNRDLHQVIVEATRNSQLVSIMGQLKLQSQMLMAKTIRLSGRPSRALEEHRQLIEFIGARNAKSAEKTMEHHILSALEDILRLSAAEELKEDKEAPGEGFFSV